MKRALVVLLLLSSLAVAQAAAPQSAAPPAASTTTPAAKPEDVKSMDSIIAAVYDVISGPADKERDWDRFKSLFIPGARLIPTVKPPSSSVYMARVLTPDEFATRSGQGLKQSGTGFFEKEIARHTEQWGNIAQAFSTYESRHAAGDQPFVRGINSFQLLNDGQRWWIVTIFWQGESKDVPLTPEMLKSK
jgi:hypothetical protein